MGPLIAAAAAGAASQVGASLVQGILGGGKKEIPPFEPKFEHSPIVQAMGGINVYPVNQQAPLAANPIVQAYNAGPAPRMPSQPTSYLKPWGLYA